MPQATTCQSRIWKHCIIYSTYMSGVCQENILSIICTVVAIPIAPICHYRVIFMLGIGLFIYLLSVLKRVLVCTCSGDVVTQECVDKLIRTSNMLCPITGKTLKEKDLIPLQRVRFCKYNFYMDSF